MDCGRMLIYFSVYENGVKQRQAGYAGLFFRGDTCDVQIYYRGMPEEEYLEGQKLKAVFVFQDRSVAESEPLAFSEGMGTGAFRTSRWNFLESGKSLENLEAVYIDGVVQGRCGGRVDGQELTEEAAYTLTDWMDTVTEYLPESGEYVLEIEEKEPKLLPEQTLTGKLFEEEVEQKEKKLPEIWTLSQYIECLPTIKLPYDGVRRKCCRMTLEDLEHLPKELEALKQNHFLLHGFYEYHHLIFVYLCSRYGEQYAIGVPGEYCCRNQYMAESFGFHEFAPLEPGRRRIGSFGYWYYFIGDGKSSVVAKK